MEAYNIFKKLENAYGASTQNCNRFLKAINSIHWDEKFQADGEYYFVKGNFTFTTPSLDPFKMDWKPSAIFNDGSFIEFA